MNKLFAACCAILLGACAVPDVHYYQLPDSVFRQPESTQTIAVEVTTNDILSGNALVYQTEPETLHFARHHVWAQRLGEAAANVLANAMNDASAAGHYAPQNHQAAYPCVRVVLQQFQGTYQGKVQVAGFAQIYDKNGQLIRNRNFAVETAQHGDGYTAMVSALNQALKAAALQIIQ